MSKYTTQIRFICEHEAGYSESVGYNSVDEVISKAVDKVFSFDFPIFDPNYKRELCIKILRHYYTREISEETYGLWKLRLEAKMNEIMPYYNQLYESAMIKFNPLYDTDVTTTHLKNNEGNNEGNINTNDTDNTNNDSVTRNRYSDTPQGGLVGVENDTYLTSAEKNTNESNTHATHSGNSNTSNEYKDKEDFIQHVTGKISGGSYSKMLNEFRTTFLNIDMSIIDDLSDLFFKLW